MPLSDKYSAKNQKYDLKSGKKFIGSIGERLAEDKLLLLGYNIKERNLKLSRGEIDLVALDHGVTVIVEVRTRKDQKFGFPEESIGSRKKSKLIELCQEYILREKLTDQPVRIDVVAVELDDQNNPLRIDVFKNAIS